MNIQQWLADRQRARTDLLFLCNEVLMYPDVNREVHGEVIDALHQFRGGSDFYINDGGLLVEFSNGEEEIIEGRERERLLGNNNPNRSTFVAYHPFVSLWEQEGPRKRLILAPRGSLKTTVITVAETIQWILNYQDIRILISTAIAEQAQQMLLEIKGHFQFNSRMRFLFSEFCPLAKKASEFGTQTHFVVPNRRKKWLKEPTVSVCSVGKVIAGFHYEILKHSDLVDKENVRTPEGIRQVRDHFRYMGPLIERNPIPPHHGWEYVEGTRYDWGDLYGTEIIDKQEALPPEKKDFTILVKAAWNEKKESYWPSRWPTIELEREQKKLGDTLFSAQYLNNPVPESGGLASAKDLVFFPRKIAKQIPLRHHVTVDLHGMEQGNDNDYTVLTVAGFDNDGRMYIVEICRGRFTPFEVIEHIFRLHLMYRDADFKIEKDAHARVLLPFLERERSKRGMFPLLVPIKRDNRMSKQQRIRGLQAWFQAGAIRFADDLPCRLDLIHEITKFPKYPHDDILDTLADQMQNSEGGINYDVLPDDPNRPKQGEQFRGFHPQSHDPIFTRNEMDEMWGDGIDRRTGL